VEHRVAQLEDPAGFAVALPGFSEFARNLPSGPYESSGRKIIILTVADEVPE